jgi:hypothetical protein
MPALARADAVERIAGNEPDPPDRQRQPLCGVLVHEGRGLEYADLIDVSRNEYSSCLSRHSRAVSVPSESPRT